jgi:hypothetical protein
MSPVRIQRRRTKGWRMPEGAIYVGRPSRWGNPFSMFAPKPGSTATEIAERLKGHYRNHVAWKLDRDPGWLTPLRGHDLVCWCPLEDADGNRVPCHADVLLELANR